MNLWDPEPMFTIDTGLRRENVLKHSTKYSEINPKFTVSKRNFCFFNGLLNLGNLIVSRVSEDKERSSQYLVTRIY